jgi:hypothetical protein
MRHRNAPAKELVAIAMTLVLGCCATAVGGQRRAEMQVSCVVLPHISLQLKGQQPVYASIAATIVSEPGQVQVTSNTNDPDLSEFVLTASSEASAVINGLEVLPGRLVEVGHYGFGVPVELNVIGTEPIRLTASR